MDMDCNFCGNLTQQKMANLSCLRKHQCLVHSGVQLWNEIYIWNIEEIIHASRHNILVIHINNVLSRDGINDMDSEIEVIRED